MEVWMGTTMACAQCHNHKYDPITQEEYFRFFAFFNNTQDADKTDESPVLSSYWPLTNAPTATIAKRISSAVQKDLLKPKMDLTSAQIQWEQTFPLDLQWQKLNPAAVDAPKNLRALVCDCDGRIEFGVGVKKSAYIVTIPLGAMTLSALRLEVLPSSKLPEAKLPDGDFVIDQNFGQAEAAWRAQEIAFGQAVADHANSGAPTGDKQLLQEKNPKARRLGCCQ